MTEKKDTKHEIIVRMKRIEGQVKGIEKMIENEACCKDMLIQVAAVRAAINRVGSMILQNYAQNCFIKNDELSEGKQYDEKINELVKVINMFLK